MLGGNFAGLGAAQKIRKYAGNDIQITVIDRKTYLGSGPNGYIRSNSWCGGKEQLLKMGHTAHFLKQEYRNLFFLRHAKIPSWGLNFSELLQEKILA